MTRTEVISASRLAQDNLRLDGAYYCSVGEDTRRFLRLTGIPLDTVGDVSSDIFIGGRSRRLYVSNASEGVQFLSSSDMLLADMTTVPKVSYRQPDLESLLLQNSWILISRSGTIGRVVYANDDMAGKAASEHIMRVVPNDRILPGYLFAWLASPEGVGLIKQNTFGSVIPTIEPAYVASLPVPRLSVGVETSIHNCVQEAAAKRCQANRIFVQVRWHMYDVTKLPYLGILPLGRNLAGPRTYAIYQSALGTRFEARYHDSLVRELEERIRKNPHCGWTTLGEYAAVFLPDRGKWANVSVGGIPFVGSGDMFLARPVASRHVSASLSPRVTQLLVQTGDILVARSGQIYSILGDAVMVGRSLASKAVTEDAIRIIAKPELIHPGFLYAFLTLPDYGYGQLVRTAYGTSIPHLPVHELPAILVPLPDKRLRDAIGDNVLQAIELRDEANDLEDQAQDLLSVALGTAHQKANR